MNKKAWIIFAAVCIALLGALVYFSAQNRVDVSRVDTNAVLPASEESGNIADHVYGDTDSKVVLIEYGDFQCPGCASAFPRVKAAKEKYKDQLAFVFRNFPIASIHPNARAASAAAEAAGLQSKFWEMHDKLYQFQSAWSNVSASDREGVFTGYAEELGLDLDKFKEDYTSTTVNQKITFDTALAKKVGVTGTPTFFLNGEKVEQETWSDQDALEKLIADTLKQHNIRLPEDDK